MNRQHRRRIEREWNKLEFGESCSQFIVHNNLYALPYVVDLRAIKVDENLICVHYIDVFGFKEGQGYLEHVNICQFLSGHFRSLCSLSLGFVDESELDWGEEIE